MRALDSTIVRIARRLERSRRHVSRMRSLPGLASQIGARDVHGGISRGYFWAYYRKSDDRRAASDPPLAAPYLLSPSPSGPARQKSSKSIEWIKQTRATASRSHLRALDTRCNAAQADVRDEERKFACASGVGREGLV